MKPLDSNVFIEETPFKLMGVDFGNRMTVIRLGDGSLWLHSLVPLDQTLQGHLNELGSVKHLVVPNTAHNLFSQPYQSTYPEACLYAPAGARRVVPDRILTPETLCACERDWNGEIQVYPVEGLAVLDEYAFFHPASGILILTDLAFNVDRSVNAWSRLMFGLYGALDHFGPTRLMRLLIRDKSAFQRSIARLADLNMQKIVVSHGKCVQNGAKQAFLDAFSGN